MIASLESPNGLSLDQAMEVSEGKGTTSQQSTGLGEDVDTAQYTDVEVARDEFKAGLPKLGPSLLSAQPRESTKVDVGADLEQS